MLFYVSIIHTGIYIYIYILFIVIVEMNCGLYLRLNDYVDQPQTFDEIKSH